MHYQANKKSKNKKMKKIALIIITTISLMSCDTKSNGHNVPSNATGYTIDSSANTDLVIKAANALVNNDTTTYKSCYSSDAIFHDNNDSANLTKNVAGIQAMHDKGIVWKLNKIGAIWETVDLNPKANENTSYVISYQNYTLTKGDKSIVVRFNVLNNIKDGKLMSEYLRYDNSGITELMK
jgi:hypothetical protein